MSEPSIYERLAAPFALADHAKVPKGGMTQTYAPWTAYVERLNDVLGADHWSFRVIREGFTETECWVLGEITAVIDGETVTRQQYGCEPIVKGMKATPTNDLLKTAATDAIKKAASLIGPGLYLSVKEEREVIDQAMQEAIREASRPKPTVSTPRVAAAAQVTGADPTALKTKAELAADLKKGLDYARSIGLEPDDVDPAPLNRAQIEETINALRQQCRDVLVARKQQSAL